MKTRTATQRPRTHASVASQTVATKLLASSVAPDAHIQTMPLARHSFDTLPMQAKLAIDTPGDAYEQEADLVARKVTESISRSPGALAAPDVAMTETPGISRYVQRSGEGAASVAPDVETTIQSARGSGQEISRSQRAPLEQAFGADFGGVRIHTDARADSLNRSLSARAFTTGQDIFFRQGEYQPQSNAGKELLAHELTHVVQQNGGSVQRAIVQRQCSEGEGDEIDEAPQTPTPENPEEETPIQRSLMPGATSATISRARFGVQRDGEEGATTTSQPQLMTIDQLATAKDATAAAKVLSDVKTAGSKWPDIKGAFGRLTSQVMAMIRGDSSARAALFALCENGVQKAQAIYYIDKTEAGKNELFTEANVSHDNYRQALVELGVFEAGTAGHKRGEDVDKLIAKDLSTFVQGAVNTGSRIAGHIAVLDAVDWDIIGKVEYGGQWATKVRTLNAFVDRSSEPPRVFVNKDRGNAGTAIHEACHMWSHPSRLISAANHDLNEGITEYFARKVCAVQDPVIARNVYNNQYRVAAALAALVGDATLGAAYFDGNFAGLKTKVGTEKWTSFIDELDSENWDDAISALAGG